MSIAIWETGEDILLEHAKKVNEENRAKVREEIKMMRELRK